MTPPFKALISIVLLILCFFNCTNDFNPEDKLIPEIKNFNTTGSYSRSYSDSYENDNSSGSANSITISNGYLSPSLAIRPIFFKP